MDFIFMLTENDRTIADSGDLIDEIKYLGLKHIGCKEIGIDFPTMRALIAKIKSIGATSYVELVGATKEQSEQAAYNALEAGAERILGGFDPDSIAPLCAGKAEYFPFAGEPRHHPTQLFGNVHRIAADCRRFQEMGCAGVDLLAYRAVEASPLDLVRAARAASDACIIVAGSIASVDRIAALKAAGADAFTMGTAIFDKTFATDAASLQERLARAMTAAR